MRVLVTGGAGYIGSHAVRTLARQGHEIVIYDNLSLGHSSLVRNFELIIGDIGDPDALRPALRGIDAVMHFAANAYVGESVKNPRKYFDNNVRAALNLLNCAVDASVRSFVFSSTCAIYGVPEATPITEDTPPKPINPYGITKLFFENALQSYRLAYGMRSVCLRYFNAAGADPQGETGELHEPETHLVPLVLAAAAGRNSEVKVYGDDYPTPDGTCVRDYIHVSDLAEAHALALEHLHDGGDNEVLNLGTGTGYSVREIIQNVERVTQRNVLIKVLPRRPGDPPSLVANSDKASRILGWKPKYQLSDIVQHAWEWFHSHQTKTAGALMQRTGSHARISTNSRSLAVTTAIQLLIFWE